MAILSRIKNFMSKTPKNSASVQLAPTFSQGLPISRDNRSEVTYLTCLKILSESLGKLDLKLYQKTSNNGVKTVNNDLSNILAIRPNPYSTASSFWTTVEEHRNRYGNAYVYIERTGTKLKNLWIMSPDQVTILVDNKGLFGEQNAIYYRYEDTRTGNSYCYSEEEVLHFRSSITTCEGIVGLSIADILATTFQGKIASQEYLNNLFRTGMTGRAVLEYSGDLSDEAQKRLVAGLENFANGATNAGKIIPIPTGFRLQTLNSSLVDSQFEQIKKYTDLQIASVFGIPSNMLNNMENSSYSSVEAQNLNFLVNTMSSILKQYEQEITYKLLSTSSIINKGLYFEFDVSGLLRADVTTKMNYLSSGVGNGILTQNEARSQIGLEAKENGDNLIVNGAYIPTTLLGANYGITPRGGESGGKE